MVASLFKLTTYKQKVQILLFTINTVNQYIYNNVKRSTRTWRCRKGVSLKKYHLAFRVRKANYPFNAFLFHEKAFSMQPMEQEK